MREEGVTEPAIDRLSSSFPFGKLGKLVDAVHCEESGSGVAAMRTERGNVPGA